MATRHIGSRNSLEDPNSNSAKPKNAVENSYVKSFKEIILISLKLFNDFVDFLPKNMNPANVPQLHPIEIFCASMKCELRNKGKIPAINQFCQIWGVASQIFTKSVSALN